MRLFQIGGLGAPFNLSLPVRSETVPLLSEPLLVQFTVLEEKFVGRTVQSGRLTALSDSDGILEADASLTTLCNLKISIPAADPGKPTGEVYAKVTSAISVEATASYKAKIRVTSVSPELKNWLLSLVSAPKSHVQPGET